MHFSLDDIRIVLDIICGSILASGVRLVIMKAFLEPAAHWVGVEAYRYADRSLGDRLPDWVPPRTVEAKTKPLETEARQDTVAEQHGGPAPKEGGQELQAEGSSKASTVQPVDDS